MTLPICNERAQLWYQKWQDGYGRLRIVYPNGKVEYFHDTHGIWDGWKKSCFIISSVKDQRSALCRMMFYDKYSLYTRPAEFIGYI